MLKNPELFSLTERVNARLHKTLCKVAEFIYKLSAKRLEKSDFLFTQLKNNGVPLEKRGKFIAAYPTINNVKLEVLLKRKASDPFVYRQVLFSQEYSSIVRFFQQNNLALNSIVDAGANIGLTTLYFKAHFPEALVIALEPNANTFKRLTTNLDLNKTSNTTTLEKGLWKSDCILNGNYSFRDHQDWSYCLQETSANKRGNVECISVDSLLNQCGLDEIDLFKIDIEGSEDALFENEEAVENWLPKVKIVAAEVHEEFNCSDRIESILRKFNFNIEHVGELTVGVNQAFFKNKALPR